MTPFEQSSDNASVANAASAPDPSTDQTTAQPVGPSTSHIFDRASDASTRALTESGTPSARTQPSLVCFDNVRVDTNGRIVCAGLTFEAYDCPIAICGPAGEALIHGLAAEAFGESKIMQGRVLVDGLNVSKKEHFSKVAIALANPARPRAVSVKTFLRMHGVASGLSRSKANDNARAALSDLGLRKLENMLVETLSTEQLRCATLAAALVTARPIVVAQTPVAGLDSAQAKFVLSVLGQIARRTKVIVTAQRVDASSPEYHLVMGTRRVVMTNHQSVLWQGTPHELSKMSHAVSLWVQGNVMAFGQMLAQRGFELWPKVAGCAQNIEQSDQVSAFVTVLLPEGKTQQHLLQVAHDCQIAVLQMLPLLPGSFDIPAQNQHTAEQPSHSLLTTQHSSADHASALDPIAQAAPIATRLTGAAIPEPGKETGMENRIISDISEPPTTLP